MSDLKRPLSNTGYSDAQIMSGIFNNLNINVETIFSSPAIRTVQTAQVFSKSSNINGMHVPTCGILIFEFDVSLWQNINLGKCNYYFPKNFK